MIYNNGSKVDCEPPKVLLLQELFNIHVMPGAFWVIQSPIRGKCIWQHHLFSEFYNLTIHLMSFHPYTSENSYCCIPSPATRSSHLVIWPTRHQKCINTLILWPALLNKWSHGGERSHSSVLLPTDTFPFMEAHSNKCLVGGTQLQSNVIASSSSHYPRCWMHHSHHFKSDSGSCLWEEKHERNVLNYDPLPLLHSMFLSIASPLKPNMMSVKECSQRRLIFWVALHPF